MALMALGGGLAGVVSLLALDEGPCVGCVGVAVGVAGTLVLVQALGDVKAGGPLWVLTRGAVAAGPDEGVVSLVQAQVWGLGRVAALEYPDRWGGLVDVPPRLDRRAGERLCALLGGAGEDQVAVREAGVLARRLVRAPLPDGGGEGWMPSGTVLVTGGTGVLGGHVARWLAGGGAGQVVLAGRQGPGAPGAARLAAELAGCGAGVVVAGCDVADRGVLGGLLAWLSAAGRPVTGVVHAAGAGLYAPLAGTSLAEFAAVARAKVTGAVNLDALLADDVDAFVLFSSGAGVWGSGGQGAYAAANACLDALAQQRRARGAAATSVAWGLWDGGGMAAGGEETLRRRGIQEMAPHLAITALGQALDQDEAVIAVADVDWEQFARAFTSLRPSPLLAEISEAQQAMAAERSSPEDENPGGGVLAGQLAGLTQAEQEQVVLNVVRTQAASVLGHASAEAVPPGAVFRELGFDSLTAVDFRDHLNAATGLRLPATLVFDYPSPVVLAGWLRGEILQEGLANVVPLLAELDKLEAQLLVIAADGNVQMRIRMRLQALLSKWDSILGPANGAAITDRLQSATAEEVLQFIDAELDMP